MRKCRTVLIKCHIDNNGYLLVNKKFFGVYTEQENFIRLTKVVKRIPCDAEIEATINPLGEICYRGKVVGYEDSTPYKIA